MSTCSKRRVAKYCMISACRCPRVFSSVRAMRSLLFSMVWATSDNFLLAVAILASRSNLMFSCCALMAASLLPAGASSAEVRAAIMLFHSAVSRCFSKSMFSRLRLSTVLKLVRAA